MADMNESGEAGTSMRKFGCWEDPIRSRFSREGIEQIRSDSAELDSECGAYALAHPEYAREHRVWQQHYEAECVAYEQAITADKTRREAYEAALAVRAATTSTAYEQAIADGETVRQAIDVAMGVGAVQGSGGSG